MKPVSIGTPLSPLASGTSSEAALATAKQVAAKLTLRDAACRPG